MSGSDDGQRAAVVTGGTRGIGRATCELFVSRGLAVTATYRSDEESADQLREWASEVGADLQVVRGDVAVEEDVHRVFEEHRARFERCDVLVNNAAIRKDVLGMMMKMEDWQRTLDVNLTGPFLCSRRAMRFMISQRWGRIVNVISPSALSGREGQSAYSASKGGLLSLTKTLAAEGSRFGILVNAVAPGVVPTTMVGDVPEEVMDDLRSTVPMGRFGEPSEIAEAIAFLASEDAAYITGQFFSVDGGLGLVGKLRAST